MNIQIPISQPLLGKQEEQLVLDCLQTGWISSKGQYVERFEREFASKVGCAHAISVSNGTAALHLALLAAGIGPGDEVIVPDLTFAATANAVIHCGAVPVLAAVRADNWTLDLADLDRCYSPRCKAIIPVHLYGTPADMPTLRNYAQARNLLLIEDCAESLGATIDGEATGSFGDFGCFSFFANKLITTGEGGMVTTQDAVLAAKVRQLRDHGMRPEKRYWHEVAGLNYRMTNIQAALGVSQLAQMDDFIIRRQQIELLYRELLADLDGIVFKQDMPGIQSVNWLTSVCLDSARCGFDASQLHSYLQRQGIETRPFFYPLHQQPPYHGDAKALQISVLLQQNGLSLPTYVELTDLQIREVCQHIRQFCQLQRGAA